MRTGGRRPGAALLDDRPRTSLDVKVAVPVRSVDSHADSRSDGIFHEKAGIIQDGGGHRIAWNGSLNETAAGWRHNWESINVYTSWGTEPGTRHPRMRRPISRALWGKQGRSARVIVLDVPEAAAPAI